MPKAEKSLNEILYDLKRIEEHRELLSEKKIRKIYESLMSDLNAFIANEYLNYADGNGALAYTTLQEKSREARFLEEIINKVDGITPELKREISALVEKTYTNCYKGMFNAVNNAANTKELAAIMTDTTIRPEVLKQTVQNNISKLTLPNVLEKHRQDIIYQIKQELTVGMINGDRYDTMAQKISERVNVSYSKATNIVRTESHRNIESGLNDCANDISTGLDGSGLVYVSIWRTMKDERVRPQVVKKSKKHKYGRSKNNADHTKMEGVTIRVGDTFKLYPTGKAKCPSRSGIAAQDCRCRCFLEYDLLTEEEFEKLPNKQINNKSVNNAISESLRKQMDKANIPNVDLKATANKQGFAEAVTSAKKSNLHGCFVDEHPIDELKRFKTFLSKDNMAGVAVMPDGNITSVFKNSALPTRGVVNDLIMTARENGGIKMDCYGVGLVNMYEKTGYKAVARIPFNADYVTDEFLLKTKPDVYVLMKTEESNAAVVNKIANKSYKLSMQSDLDKLKTFEDYDEALKFRDNLLK